MKYVILITLALMVVVVGTADAQLSPKLDSLREYISDDGDFPLAGTDQLDTALIIRQIAKAVRQVCQDFPAYEKLDTVLVDSASEGGSLPADFHRVKEVFLMLGDTLRVPLQLSKGDSLFLNRPSILASLMDLADLLSVRFYHVHAGQLVLHPKWWRGDTANVLVEYYAIDTTHLIAGDSAIKIRPKYRDKVVEYVVSRLWSIRGNVPMADHWMAQYEKGMIKDED